MVDEDSGRPTSVRSDIASGAGIGLLLGVLVGLSSSPVVGIVAGALASILAVFLGLDPKAKSFTGALRINGTRIFSLGLTTVVGIGCGLYVRINNPIADSPVAQLERWSAALPNDPTLAKQLMVFERTGIEPSRFHFGTEVAPADIDVKASKGAATRQAVLFSTLSKFDVCTRLNPDRFTTDADLLETYSRDGAPDILPQIATSIELLPEHEQKVALAIAHDVLCLAQREEAR